MNFATLFLEAAKINSRAEAKFRFRFRILNFNFVSQSVLVLVFEVHEVDQEGQTYQSGFSLDAQVDGN